MTPNAKTADYLLRRELLFGDRIVSCFAPRPDNLNAIVEQAVTNRGAEVGLVHEGMRLTWAEVADQSARLAGGLSAIGVGPGDRVALMLSNCGDYVLLLFAIARLGAIAVPISARESARGVAFMVGQSRAKVLIHDAGAAPSIEAMERSAALERTISLAGPVFMGMREAAPASAARVDPEAVAAILYTSGTTGRPKGATITHVNIIHSVMNYAIQMKLGPEDRGYVAVPISHVTGLVALVWTLAYAEGRLIVGSEFKAPTFLRQAAREGMTYTLMVPAMYNLCLLQPELKDHDLSAWRVAGYGGAPMPLATIEQLAEVLPRLGLFNVYGATETTSPATMLPPDFIASARHSVGRALAGAQIAIMDERGCEAPCGEIGEIWIGGPMVVPGYWQNPEATSTEFRGGFWRSGDLGRMDEQGLLQVLDRKKDMINRGGYKIYSAEVESALAEHPDIVEAAIVGRSCPVLGERVHAFITLRGSSGGVSVSELSDFVAQRIADYKRPETWSIGTEPLPRNANGKIAKNELRTRL